DKIGVFVNASLEEIEETVEKVPLTMVQLHGDEPDELVEAIQVPVIQAFSIRSKEDVGKLERSKADFILVDAPGTDYRGGSGKVFDWSLLEGAKVDASRLIVAGGLNPANVRAAIGQTN